MLEFLLYIAISAVLLLVCTDIVFSLLRSKAKLQSVHEVSQNGRDVMERMLLAVRNANAVTRPADGTTSTNLVLQMPFTSASPTIFAIQNNVITLQEGTGASTTLMASSVTVPSLIFQNLGTATTSDSIRIFLTVSSTNPNNVQEFSFGQSFTGSASVRKTP